MTRKKSVRAEIIAAAARAAYVQAWADWAEENGEASGWGGRDLMDLAPKTPPHATKWARDLVATMEKMNGKKIDKMYWSAAQKADAATWRGGSSDYTRRYKEATPEDFGHYTAMQALGHGVSWGDDHPDHGFLIPNAEFHCYEESTCEGYVSDREGLAHRG